MLVRLVMFTIPSEMPLTFTVRLIININRAHNCKNTITCWGCSPFAAGIYNGWLSRSLLNNQQYYANWNNQIILHHSTNTYPSARNYFNSFEIPTQNIPPTFPVIYWSTETTEQQYLEARAWAPGLGFWDLKPGPSPLQALIKLWSGLNELTGLRAWSPARHITSYGLPTSQFLKNRCGYGRTRYDQPNNSSKVIGIEGPRYRHWR
jgi:hypothetical protein